MGSFNYDRSARNGGEGETHTRGLPVLPLRPSSSYSRVPFFRGSGRGWGYFPLLAKSVLVGSAAQLIGGEKKRKAKRRDYGPLRIGYLDQNAKPYGGRKNGVVSWGDALFAIEKLRTGKPT